MAEALRIFTALRQHDVYPKQGHVFTVFEAFVDLALDAYPRGVVTRSLGDMAKAWSWPKTSVDRALKSLAAQKLLQRNAGSGQWSLVKAERWYDLPTEVVDSNVLNAKIVIDIFNDVFKKKAQPNDYRIRTIVARIKEGQKLVNPVTPDSFKRVFEHKLREWGSDDEMKKFLTLETMCARKHFMKYYEHAMEARRGESQGQKLQGSIMQAR